MLRMTERKEGSSMVTKAILIATCALVLTACEGRKEMAVRELEDYRLRHPITLHQSAKTIDVPVGIHSEKLTPSSISAINLFARDFRHERAAAIQIMMPAGSDNENSARYMGKQIRTTLLRAGVSAGQIEMVPYTATNAEAAPVRLAYPRMEAKVPKCGLNPTDLSRDYNNRSHFNFGCASQANLASAVANPQDLIQPRGWDPRDSNRRSTVNEKYRNGEPTWSEDLGNKVGSSSEVQK